MATDLEGNVQLQRFIELLCQLNNQTAAAIRTGDTSFLTAINDVVEEMYSIQSKGMEDAYTAIDEDMKCIYKNFNAVVAMMRSNEQEKPDKVTGEAVRKFLHNIFDATVRIVYAYGLA